MTVVVMWIFAFIGLYFGSRNKGDVADQQLDQLRAIKWIAYAILVGLVQIIISL